MSYPSSDSSKAPKAPQVPGPGGGAPTTRSVSAFRDAWTTTGTPNAVGRTVSRTLTGADPAPVAQSLDRFWSGAARGNAQSTLPTPSTMPLPEAAKYLSDLTSQVKSRLDARMASLPAESVQGSRFWRQYQAMPEPMAALTARRIWTNTMVGTGPVADWLAWLKG